MMNSQLAIAWDALAWDVPKSDGFPAGRKYSVQYLGPADEEILRYDNANDAHGVGRLCRPLGPTTD